MCGLLGVFHRSAGRLGSLKPLLNLLHHRGPDDEGWYEDSQVQLGFRRLSIIDLETGEQPVSNEDGSVVVMLNGEIYNYVELTAELKARGHRFRSHGDSEVIAHLYEDLGDELVEKLQGMFAFVLWDRRRERLLIARDPAGIKPLYFVDGPSFVAFSSEIKPLLRLPNVSKEFSAEALGQYLTFGYTLAPDTIFRDIRKLRAGHKLVIDAERIHVSEYWNLRQPKRVSESGGALCERVLAAFDDAIRLHLRSDVPVGAFLSGGLDSGFMVARAAQIHPHIRTYTLRFEGVGQDESELAAMVASRYGTDHRLFTVPRDSMQELVPRIVWSCDEPLGDSGLLPNYVISRLAHEDGMKVVLNGAGGDELFAGYTYFFRSDVERKLERLHVPAGLAAAVFHPFNSEVSRKLRRASLFDTDPIGHYLGHVTVWPKSEIAAITSGDFRADGAAELRAEYANEFVGDCLNRKLYAEIKTYLADDLMLLLDRMTMAHSLEGRVPFLHRPFMELVMGIDGEVKAPNGDRKSLLRSVAADHLPAALLRQPKMGFNSPVREWMPGPFGDLVIGLLMSEASLGRPWWNRRAFQTFVKDRRARGVWQHRLFLLFMLEVFCRVHVDTASESAERLPSIQAMV
ncbi:MAG TPA: asparagine synthase (glutamine-hydrolyzing) [Thermoanaerobaculia bacterium]|nr:asparagine synthase (glutamine-hydrolyzing) [Thermoanaerobaculia bacterium]